MHIVRVEHRDEPAPVVGVASGDRFYPLRSVARLSQLWAMRLQDLRPLVEAAVEGEDSMPSEDVHPLSPIDGRTELWAAGVTYEKSRLARVEESERAASVYELVYDAERPEVFFKAAAWRVSGDGDAISVREDSTVTVPEPEVAIVCNRFGEVVGLSTCNDVSSRSIEGANPLYIPQAKCYLGSCALGPSIRPIWEVPDPYQLAIEMEILREGERVWAGSASTSQLRRRFEDLAHYLFYADVHPDGIVLTTGTCLVPESPFTLGPGDEVRIEVAEVGLLRNHVVRGLEAFLAVAPASLLAAVEAT